MRPRWLSGRSSTDVSICEGRLVELVDPANPPSRKAPLVWAIGAAIPWLLLAVGQLVWFVLDARLAWLHAAAAAVTALGVVVFVVVVPLWRYRVHRWDIGPQAVYTRSGWLVQERRIAPISRVQTVDTYRGPLDRLFGLANVTVTTASSAGAVRIVALDSRRRRPDRRAADRHRRDRRARTRRDASLNRRPTSVAAAEPAHAAGAPRARGAAADSAADRLGGAGFGDGQPDVVGGGAGSDDRVRRRAGGSPRPTASTPSRCSCATGVLQRKVVVGAAQQDSFGSDRCPVAAPAAGADRVAGQHRPGGQGRRRVRARRRAGRRGAAAARDPAGRLADSAPTTPADQAAPPSRVLARWQPSWLRYSPLSFTGLAMILAAVGRGVPGGSSVRRCSIRGSRESGLRCRAALRCRRQRRRVVVVVVLGLGVAVGAAVAGHVRQSGAAPRCRRCCISSTACCAVREHTYDMRRLRGGTLRQPLLVRLLGGCAAGRGDDRCRRGR